MQSTDIVTGLQPYKGLQEIIDIMWDKHEFVLLSPGIDSKRKYGITTPCSFPHTAMVVYRSKRVSLSLRI